MGVSLMPGEIDHLSHQLGRIEEPLAADPADLDLNGEFGELVDGWLALSYALNAMSRSLGNDDLYPFVLAPAVIDKLGHVHGLVERTAVRTRAD